MPTIIFSSLVQLQQVDDFPADTVRTVEGALYVRPGGTAVVSDGEADHLKSKGVKFSVVGKAKPAEVASAPTDPAPAGKPPAKQQTGLPGNPLGGGAPAGSQSGSDQK